MKIVVFTGSCLLAAHFAYAVVSTWVELIGVAPLLSGVASAAGFYHMWRNW